MLISRQLNALAALTFIGLTGLTGAAVAAGPSSQFDLNGDVVTPGVYDFSSLSTLPATTETVTYSAGGSPVIDTYTGTALWTLLGNAGGIVSVPGVKNSSLLNYVVAVGSHGCEAVFSGGEINPMFGGSPAAPDTVAYSDTGGQLGQGGQTDLRGRSSPATRLADATCPISSTSLSARRRYRPKARAACRPSSR